MKTVNLFNKGTLEVNSHLKSTHKYFFPPDIVETVKRPDINIYSAVTKNVIIIELTVPSEENLANANARKKCKYEDLVAECENRGWTVILLSHRSGKQRHL